MKALPSRTLADLDRLRRMNNALMVRVILARIARDPAWRAA